LLAKNVNRNSTYISRGNFETAEAIGSERIGEYDVAVIQDNTANLREGSR